MNTQTPDAVREAVARIVDPSAWQDYDYWASRLRGEGHWPSDPDTVAAMRRSYERRMPERVAESFRRTDAILAALDSRAGDAGEGCVTALREIENMPHYWPIREAQKVASRALSTPAPAVDAPTERQIALAKLTAMDDEMGLPDDPLPISPNAVDAVPAGEVTEAMVDAALNARLSGGTPVLAYLPTEANWTPLERAREIVRCALSAALSHGEGRKQP